MFSSFSSFFSSSDNGEARTKNKKNKTSPCPACQKNNYSIPTTKRLRNQFRRAPRLCRRLLCRLPTTNGVPIEVKVVKIFAVLDDAQDKLCVHRNAGKRVCLKAFVSYGEVGCLVAVNSYVHVVSFCLISLHNHYIASNTFWKLKTKDARWADNPQRAR